MSRAGKRARRLKEHDRWLKWTGRRCIACGQDLDDDDYGGDDPRRPRVCVDCCGVHAVVDIPPGQQWRKEWDLEDAPFLETDTVDTGGRT